MKQAIKLFTRFLKVERNASPYTIGAYIRDLQEFDSFLETYDTNYNGDIERVNRYAIRAWMSQLSEKGLTNRSIARKISTLKSFFKFTFRQGHTSLNPAELITLPRIDKKLPSTVQQSEVAELFEYFPMETDWDIQERAILELFYATGMRLSELLSLNVHDTSRGDGLLKVMGKGSKERYVPFGNSAAEAISEWVKVRPLFLKTSSDADAKKALFLSKSGKRLYPVAVQRMVKRHISRVSEATQKSPHVLRHSFATHMLNKGAGIRVIKELLGHAALTSTQEYTHTSVEHLKSVYEKAHPKGS